MFGVSLGIRVGNTNISVGGAFDSDAQAYFDRVSTAGGTLSTTEKTAVNQLVIDLKANSLWTPMKAIYPMVGASAAACAQNLKSSSFTGTFTSGWTFASTGATPNGTSAYMNTNFNGFSQFANNFASLTYYARLTIVTGSNKGNYIGTEAQGLSTGTRLTLIPSFDGSTAFYATGTSLAQLSLSANLNSGFYTTSRTANNVYKVFRNNIVLGQNTTIDISLIPDSNVFLGAVNFGTGQRYSTQECAFSSIGDGLTDTQASNFYTAVQAFQTTLSRQV